MAGVLKKQGSKIKKSPGDRIVDVIIYVGLALVALSTVLPFLYVVAGSFATDKELTEKAFFIIPEVWSLNAYKYAIKTANILRGLKNSVILTALGTTMCMVFSLTFAYPLSKKHFRGRNLILNLVIVTMLFGGGMIPSYLVYCAYGLYDSYWALILPALISPFNMIIIKNFFQDLPQELEDAAYIDGCSDIGTFVKIVLPLSKPAIATLCITSFTFEWNDFMGPLIYISTTSKKTIQLLLRMFNTQYSSNYAQIMAAATVALIPVLILFAFLQRYFVEGIASSGIKG